MCGPAILKICADLYGSPEVKLGELTAMVDEQGRGTSMYALRNALRRIGFPGSEGVVATPEDLIRLRKPAVLLIQQESDGFLGHYVLFVGMREADYLIVDAVEGLSSLSQSGLQRSWKGHSIIVSRMHLGLPTSSPAPQPATRPRRVPAARAAD